LEALYPSYEKVLELLGAVTYPALEVLYKAIQLSTWALNAPHCIRREMVKSHYSIRSYDKLFEVVALFACLSTYLPILVLDA
jgi:hypothetical protein